MAPDPASPPRHLFKAGDTVKHRPSGEEWVLACDEEMGRVMPAGWPESLASARDCDLLTAASFAEQVDMLQKASGGSGYRASLARHQLKSALETKPMPDPASLDALLEKWKESAFVLQEQAAKTTSQMGGIPSQCGKVHPSPPHGRCHGDYGHMGEHHTTQGNWTDVSSPLVPADTPPESDEPDVQLLAWAVSNCHTLARRRLNNNSSDSAWWKHILRICEKAGARSQGVLRTALPTEITEGESSLGVPADTRTEQPPSLTRYHIWGDNENCRAVDPDGDWVKFSDLASLGVVPPPPAGKEQEPEDQEKSVTRGGTRDYAESSSPPQPPLGEK